MKLSSDNSAILGLLFVLLAFPATVATALDATRMSEAGIAGEKGAREVVKLSTRVLVDCTDDDFLVTEFVVMESGGFNTTEESFEGCYEVADTLDDDLELSVFKIDGDQTAAGGAFYASDNNGGYEEPVWFFANVQEGTATQNVSDSFLCFDLDLNAADETHPADVTNWGLTIDGSSSTSRVCDIAITCGCSADSDDDDEEEAADDDDAADGDTASNSAFSVTTTTTTTTITSAALISGSILLAIANGARP